MADRRIALAGIVALVIGLLLALLAAAVGGPGGPPRYGLMGPAGMMGADGTWGPNGPKGPPGPFPLVSPEPGERGGAFVVHMAGSRFEPARLKVRQGTTVTWTNDDTVPHTVAADDGSWSSGNLAPGATYTRTFARTGRFDYHCTYHPSMRGSVIVQGP